MRRRRRPTKKPANCDTKNHQSGSKAYVEVPQKDQPHTHTPRPIPVITRTRSGKNTEEDVSGGRVSVTMGAVVVTFSTATCSRSISICPSLSSRMVGSDDGDHTHSDTHTPEHPSFTFNRRFPARLWCLLLLLWLLPLPPGRRREPVRVPKDGLVPSSIPCNREPLWGSWRPRP